MRLQVGLVGVGINLGPAGGQRCGGVAPRLQAAQPFGLGAGPGRLGKRLPHLQGPIAANALALPAAGFFTLLRAGDLDIGLRHRGLHARIDGNAHRGQHLRVTGRGLQDQLHRRGEIAQGAQEFANVGIGHTHQAGQFLAAQTFQVAVAVEFQVRLQQVLCGLGLGANHQLKIGLAFGGAQIFGLAQQAATGQQHAGQ